MALRNRLEVRSLSWVLFRCSSENIEKCHNLVYDKEKNGGNGMEVLDWLFLVFLISGVIIIAVSICLLIWGISEEKIYRKKLKKIEISLLNILDTYYKTRDYDECIFEIDILFKNIIWKNDRLSICYSNVVVLLEDYISAINSNTLHVVNCEKSLYKKAIKELIEKYKERNPLEQLKGNDFLVLNELIECLEKDEIEKGKKVINQLAVEMKSLRDANMENEKNSRKQNLLARTGIILSIVFGAMTFIQFFI